MSPDTWHIETVGNSVPSIYFKTFNVLLYQHAHNRYLFNWSWKDNRDTLKSGYLFLNDQFQFVCSYESDRTTWDWTYNLFCPSPLRNKGIFINEMHYALLIIIIMCYCSLKLQGPQCILNNLKPTDQNFLMSLLRKKTTHHNISHTMIRSI